jgi:hypothetical protein
MKKIIIISTIAAVLGILLYWSLGYFKFFWGFQILLLPMIPGILMVLVQNGEKSYKFLPKLIVGSFFTSFIFCLLLLVISFFSFNDGFGYSILEMIISMIPLFTFLFGVIFFGGLIGIVIRGSSLFIRGQSKKS